jgi:thioredoxin reductase (NADPH)
MERTMDARNDSPDSRPVLLVVDAGQDARERITTALCRRFGTDYQVLTADSAGSGVAMLDQLITQGAEVALVAVDHSLLGTDGIEFLAQARARHATATRALLVGMDRRGTRIPFSALESLQRATALGRIDFWVVKGWQSPEELLYPQVQEALSQWTRANRPCHEVVRVIGERWSAQCHAVRDMLSRNTVPFGFYETDSPVGMQLMQEYGLDPDNLPATVFHDGTVLQNPTGTELAAALGMETQPTTCCYDLAIVGGGPAGLAAAVYGASEGLRTVVIEQQAIGGQAGTSSMIRNYLGFPRGLSGGELTFRAFEQALLFGTQFIFSHGATSLSRQDGQQVITMADGAQVRAKAVIVAAGVSYRRLGIPALDRLVGRGVFYGAAGVEAPAMTGEQVYVIGGANSAGQAALHLAKFAAKVTLLVRGDSLEAGMSEYLITQLEATPNIAVRLRTQVVDGHGADRLEALVLEDGEAGTREDVPAAAVFVLIGAEPRTEWLDGAVARDEQGFVLTGRDLCPQLRSLERQPLPYETSQPGVFAVGDVRHGAVMRVASAVGEGSVAVGSVHQYLAENCHRRS